MTGGRTAAAAADPRRADPRPPGVAPAEATGTVLLGTRRSALARRQSQTVADQLAARAGVDVRLVEVTTFGDVSPAAIATLGGTGVFVTALRDAVLAGTVDIAVHSLKDLPTAPAPGLVIGAVPAREDPRDALVCGGGQTLDGLPPGARVGTGSPRRAAQLRALRPDLEVVAIRGNVDTRVGRVLDGELAGVVLARAGLARLGCAELVSEILEPDRMLPAPGQGALAVECRAGDERNTSLLAGLEDPDARVTVTAERALLAALGAGCTAPVGALATTAPGPDGRPELFLRAVVAATDGSRSVRSSTTGPLAAPEQLGRRLAAELLAAGAADLIAESS